MFVGILIGLVVGLLFGVFLGSSVASWPKFVESTAIGFGIGAALLAIGSLLNLGIGFLDKQSQKVRGGAP